MKTFMLILLLFAGILQSNAQSDTAHAQSDAPHSQSDTVHRQTDTSRDIIKIEIESEFPGGAQAWLAFLNSHFTYPKKAIKRNIQGTVLLQFIVEKDGSLSSISALTGDPLLQEAALKVISESPKWRPAIQNGKYVRSWKKQPIVFKLQG